MQTGGESMQFGAILRENRRKAGMSRAAVAAAAGISPHTVASYERGVRLPSDTAILRRLAEALGVVPDGLLEAAGMPASKVARTEIVRMGDLASLIESYPWPCLMNNENIEVVGTNAAARAVAGHDLARRGEPGDRHLLRLVLDPVLGTHLTNGDDVIRQLASIIKSDKADISGPAQGPRFNASVVAWLSGIDEDRRMRLFQIWSEAPGWGVGNRVSFSAQWQTDDGESLTFHCLVTPWSNLLGIWAFDWHPADARTWEWVEEHRPTAPPSAAPAPWHQYLAERRLAYGFTQKEFARAAGVSVDAVFAWEKGLRRPGYRNLANLVESASIDGATAAIVVEALGYEPVPSAAYRYLQGETIPQRPDLTTLDVVAIGEEEVSAAIERHPWPVIVVDRRLTIACANLAARRRFVPGDSDVELRPQLLATFVLGPGFRSSCGNWSECAPAMLGFTSLLVGDANNHARAAGGEASLAVALRDYEAPSGSRAYVPVVWRSGGVQETFHCVISPWNIWDSYVALDFFPADGQTWDSKAP